jgi:hypothetical protein
MVPGRAGGNGGRNEAWQSLKKTVREGKLVRIGDQLACEEY